MDAVPGEKLDFGKYNQLQSHEMLFNVQSTQQPNYHASGMMPVPSAGSNSYTQPGESQHDQA